MEDSARLIERVRDEAGAITPARWSWTRSPPSVLVEMSGVEALFAVGLDYGVQVLGSTAWLLDAHPEQGHAWMDGPFAHAHPNKVLFRLDALM